MKIERHWRFTQDAGKVLILSLVALLALVAVSEMQDGAIAHQRAVIRSFLDSSNP